MTLVELSVNNFAHVLGSDAPAPGGGSAVALSAAYGVSLTKMVCELTLGKEKYADDQELIQAVHSSSERLQSECLSYVDKDTEAFNQVSAVFAMPKVTDEDKEARRQAMQEALKQATQTPLELMILIDQALTITQDAVGHSNTNAASDLGVAALQLKAGLQGAWLNVLINLNGIKDSDFVSVNKAKARAVLEAGSLKADDIYQEIQKALYI